MHFAKLSAAILAFTALANSAAQAHDFYVEPSAGYADVGAPIALSAVQVSGVFSETFPYYPGFTDRFFLASPNGVADIQGEIGADPIATVRLSEPGYHIVGVVTVPKQVEEEPEVFHQYIQNKGLDEVIANGPPPSGPKIHESYVRYAKTILGAGANPPGRNFATNLGFEFELTPGPNFPNWRPSQPATFSLLYHGLPAEHALVIVHNSRRWEDTASARTDASGRATVTLPHAGLWVAHAVHIQPGPADSDLDWQSAWASLAFELRDK